LTATLTVKGTHRAVDRLQQFARRYRYALRLDIVKHFPSLDHAILQTILAKTIRDDDVLWIVDQIIASGAGVLDDEYLMHCSRLSP
jgi:RNA-directed DNA polymerase